MEDIAIKVDNVSKVFKLPHEKNSSVKTAAVNFYKREKGYELQKALENVSLEIKKGEFFGIVGRNGSGKSTLLKLLAGIYTPTKGAVHVNGTLTPFIELGVGFNPELTGRENVYLNGALLGFSRKEMGRMYKDIVEFAELEKFMDQKLKNYSTGMQVRLAFSIAIRAQSDVLIIDEVLAVGDSNFQRKCYKVFDEIKQSGRTVVLVTHDMAAVQKYCDRAIMLHNGELVEEGLSQKVALAYEIDNAEEIRNKTIEAGNKLSRPREAKVQLKKIVINKKTSKNPYVLSLKDSIFVEVHYLSNGEHKIAFGLNFTNAENTYIAGYNTRGLGAINVKKGKDVISCLIEPGQLGKGLYDLNIGVFNYDDMGLIDFIHVLAGSDTPQFRVIEADPSKDGYFNINAQWDKPKGSS